MAEGNSRRFVFSWNQQGSVKVKEIQYVQIQDVPILSRNDIRCIKIQDMLNTLDMMNRLQSLEIQVMTISLSFLSFLSSLSSLKSLQIGGFSWSRNHGDPPLSLPSLYKGWVDKERDNHVSSVPDADGGGREILGPRTVISPTKQKKKRKRRKSTVIPHGTDLESSVQSDNHVSSVPDADGGENPAHGTGGLESSVQSVISSFLRRVVDKWGNCGDWERMLEEFDLESVLRNTSSYSDLLKKITNNVRSEFPRLLQLRDRNPSLSSKDLKVYCVLLGWSSKKRVDFWSDLSDKLFSRANAPNMRATLKKLKLELERTWQLHFRWKRIDIIDKKWIKKYGERWQQYFGKKWFHKIDERWIQKNGRAWIDKIDREWIRIIKPDYRPRDSNGIFVRELLRFIRNRQHHLDKFQESQGFHSSVESFYNYFDERFPNILMVLYGVAYQFCKDEPWFKKYR